MSAYRMDASMRLCFLVSYTIFSDYSHRKSIKGESFGIPSFLADYFARYLPLSLAIHASLSSNPYHVQSLLYYLCGRRSCVLGFCNANYTPGNIFDCVSKPCSLNI